MEDAPKMEGAQEPVCPQCRIPMEFMRKKDFSSNAASLLFCDEGPVLDLFVCRTCRRVAFFLSAADPSADPLPWTMRRCPCCGFDYSISKDRCPQCGCLYQESENDKAPASVASDSPLQDSEVPEPAEMDKSPKKRDWFRKKETDPWD